MTPLVPEHLLEAKTNFVEYSFTLKVNMQAFTQQQICLSLALRLKAIVLSVDTSLDRYESEVQGQSAVKQVMAMRELLRTLCRERVRAEQLSGAMPSPNQMSGQWAEEIAGAGNTLFAFIERCGERIAELRMQLQNVPSQLPDNSVV